MRQTKKLKIGLVQMTCGVDPEGNLKKAASEIREAVQQGAQIICLQELFRTPYFCREEDETQFDLAEPIPGPTTDRLSDVARETSAVVIASLFERRTAGIYHNTAVVIDDNGSLLGIYRKTHIPDDPLYYEKFYFTPGDLGFRVFDTRLGRIGVLVCWDQWYPEAARLTALKGAEILFYPTAIGWHPKEKQDHGDSQFDAWQTIQRSHAIANGVYVASVNRVGLEGTGGRRVEFWGGSFVCDPFGRMLGQAAHDREETLVVECDLQELETIRRNWPFLRDRRIDMYEGITRRLID